MPRHLRGNPRSPRHTDAVEVQHARPVARTTIRLDNVGGEGGEAAVQELLAQRGLKDEYPYRPA